MQRAASASSLAIAWKTRIVDHSWGSCHDEWRGADGGRRAGHDPLLRHQESQSRKRRCPPCRYRLVLPATTILQYGQTVEVCEALACLGHVPEVLEVGPCLLDPAGEGVRPDGRPGERRLVGPERRAATILVEFVPQPFDIPLR